MPHRPERPRPASHPTQPAARKESPLPVRRIYSLFQMCFYRRVAVIARVIIFHTSGFPAVVMEEFHRVQTSQPNSVGLACIWRSTVSQLPDCNETTMPKGCNMARTASARSRRVLSPLAYHKVRRASLPAFFTHARTVYLPASLFGMARALQYRHR